MRLRKCKEIPRNGCIVKFLGKSRKILKPTEFFTNITLKTVRELKGGSRTSLEHKLMTKLRYVAMHTRIMYVCMYVIIPVYKIQKVYMYIYNNNNNNNTARAPTN
jgi:hypothetical protein